MKTKTIKDRVCVSCGKKFDVELDAKSGKILTKGIFYGGKIRLGLSWSKYQWIGFDEKKGKPILKRVHPWYRELKYELINFKRRFFHQYKDVEYWECQECTGVD